MGLFDFLKSENCPGAVFPASVGAAVKGTVVPMEKIPDEVFSAGVLGTCCGIEPEDGNIYAPFDGKISQLADTLHAVGVEAGGLELLIHIGIDTVDMNGDGFSARVKAGQRVKKGDLLLTIDLEKIRAARHATVVILAVTNSEDLTGVACTASGSVMPGEELLSVEK